MDHDVVAFRVTPRPRFVRRPSGDDCHFCFDSCCYWDCLCHWYSLAVYSNPVVLRQRGFPPIVESLEIVSRLNRQLYHPSLGGHNLPEHDCTWYAIPDQSLETHELAIQIDGIVLVVRRRHCCVFVIGVLAMIGGVVLLVS